MRSLILCEGTDDVLILGYFLHKTLGWWFKPKARFAEKFNLPKDARILLILPLSLFQESIIAIQKKELIRFLY